MKYKMVCGFLSMILVLQPQCILAEDVENNGLESSVIQEQGEAVEKQPQNAEKEMKSRERSDEESVKSEKTDQEGLLQEESEGEEKREKSDENKSQEPIDGVSGNLEGRKENPDEQKGIEEKTSEISRDEEEDAEKEEKEKGSVVQQEEQKDIAVQQKDSQEPKRENSKEAAGENQEKHTESEKKPEDEVTEERAEQEREKKNKEEEEEKKEEAGGNEENPEDEGGKAGEKKEGGIKKDTEEKLDKESEQEAKEKDDRQTEQGTGEKAEEINTETENQQNIEEIVSQKLDEQESRDQPERNGQGSEDSENGETVSRDSCNIAESREERQKGESVKNSFAKQETAEGKEKSSDKKEQDGLADVKIMVENIQPFCSSSKPVAPKITVENLSKDQGNVEVILESRSQGVILSETPYIEESGHLTYALPEILEDDQYILRIKEHTKEGMKEQAVVFSVNQAGTIFSYDQSKANVCLSETFCPQIRLKNVDTTEIISCLVNGKEIAYEREGDEIMIDEKNLQEGKNQIVVAVRDQAGNISVMKPWEFVIQHSQDKEIDREKKKTDSEPANFWEYLRWILEELIPVVIGEMYVKL